MHQLYNINNKYSNSMGLKRKWKDEKLRMHAKKSETIHMKQKNHCFRITIIRLFDLQKHVSHLRGYSQFFFHNYSKIRFYTDSAPIQYVCTTLFSSLQVINYNLLQNNISKSHSDHLKHRRTNDKFYSQHSKIDFNSSPTHNNFFLINQILCTSNILSCNIYIFQHLWQVTLHSIFSFCLHSLFVL